MIKKIKKQYIALMGNPDWIAMSGVMCFGTWKVDDNTPTACTDGKNVWYGAKFCEDLVDPELRFLILHENFHKMARHMYVYKAMHTLDHARANAACDYWINGELIKQDARRGFIKMIKGGLYNPKYYGWTVTEIFKDLEGKGKGGDDEGEGGDGGQGDKPKDKDGSGNEITEGYPKDGGGFDDHDWDGGELSDEDKEGLEKDIEIAIRQGKALAGKMDGNSPRFMDKMLEGKVDYRKELADFLKQVMAGRDESSWSKINRRMFHVGYFPSAISTTCGRLAVAIDASGSITDRIVARCTGEVKKLCLELNPAGLDVIWWDTEVCSVQSFEQGQYDNIDNVLRAVGGGGTRPQCVADWLTENKTMNHECVVLLSDGYVDSFPVFDIPSMWIMTTGIVAPHGKTVPIDLEGDF
jgi:predicted metal-dependent peptidase